MDHFILDDENIDVTEAVTRLNKDMLAAAKFMEAKEARFLVDSYYATQKDRMKYKNQIRAMSELGEPHQFLTWMYEQARKLERYSLRALDVYSSLHPVGEWARSNVGIGPVTAAGLLAHINIEKAPTVGHIWSFAGLSPHVKWEKGKPRPYNATLKLICYYIGESFVRNQNRDGCVYGQLFAKKKKELEAKNARHDYREAAEDALIAKRYSPTTKAFASLKEGELPQFQIHARARRWTVKIFLSHLHHVWYEYHFKASPPKPFAIEHMGHVDFIPIPNYKPLAASGN